MPCACLTPAHFARGVAEIAATLVLAHEAAAGRRVLAETCKQVVVRPLLFELRER